MTAAENTVSSEPQNDLPEYRRPEVEAVLTPAELEREVLFAGGPYQFL